MSLQRNSKHLSLISGKGTNKCVSDTDGNKIDDWKLKFQIRNDEHFTFFIEEFYETVLA